MRSGRRSYGVAVTSASRCRERSRAVRIVGAMPSTACGQLAERAVTVEQGADDAQAPAVADAAGGGVEGVRPCQRCIAASLESLAIR